MNKIKFFYRIGNDLFKFFNEFYTIIEKDLCENTNSASKAPKKPKKQQQKENSNPNTTDLMDIDAEVINDVQNNNEQANKAKKPNNVSKKINYTHRLSYTCTLKLFKIIFRYSNYRSSNLFYTH